MEIRCPNCGGKFSIDGQEYLEIANQVKSAEFVKEVQAAVDTQLQLQRQADEIKRKNDQSVWERRISDLEKQAEKHQSEQALAVLQAQQKKDEEMQALKAAYDKEVAELRHDVLVYKEYKSRLSTKMVGESLEQYCLNKFNEMRPTAFRNAVFEKDNEVVDHSKADFIYRDYTDDGVEYISIIFEMKHEADETKTKHKNEHFLAELDKDRRNKKIEYAVLVSTLESDNDFYNGGIVDVSYRYPKMFVVRPQSFIAIITLLRNAAEQNIAQKRELKIAAERNADLQALEDNLAAFQEAFGRNVEAAKKKYQDAIDDIDKAIAALNKTKEALLSSQRQLELANNKADDLTMRKLLRNSPGLQEEYKQNKKDNK